MHAAFAEAILARDPGCPPGLRAWNHADPARRFGVYRNNMRVSLCDALADTFPVTQALVGEVFFRAMAGQFIQMEPPRSPVLAYYGAGFGAFIDGFAPAAGLPYLGDMARLEFARVLSYHAADAHAVPRGELQGLLADTDALARAVFTLHPALQILRSAYAIVSLWAAHQADDCASALAQVTVNEAESALVWRNGLALEVSYLAEGSAEFLLQLRSGQGYAEAARAALAADPRFDLTRALATLISRGAITAIHCPGKTCDER